MSVEGMMGHAIDSLSTAYGAFGRNSIETWAGAQTAWSFLPRADS